eukprot:Blabericola_migrator_1__4741@NODE_249_length_10888_cov_100_919231_g210_i0_p4_GENE_NODE_249_length_10888_cov_100_919231_g210_i0NODE_249_length_10888_cov_100_919231_g210_i0_p4_ORF_typecomplete_len242_score43_36Methyltransf_16/PF10294_9/3_9e32PrmA/PF06325_13/7_4e07Cons_hypoth95/PF03602_15/9_1e07Methyltransf_23/PF13489_6/1_6e06Methyltransf_31/PF13847_6/5e03Methyltransf_31/PF13847_6/8_5e06Methyltransf_9/PF08003_11/1e05MTS/PF05175_14/2_4e05Methyltransf_25/PF13649_6/9e05Ubie_methyltran/PF01209_18/0_000
MECDLENVDLAFKNLKVIHKVDVALTYEDESGPKQVVQSLYSSAGASTDYDLTGEVLWPMSKLMSVFILSHGELFKGKRILELGCGTGLPSFIALRQGAAHVHLTDGEACILDVCGKTIHSLPPDLRNRCSSSLLKWGHDDVSDLTGFDVIMGSDIIYWDTAIEAYCQVVLQLMTLNPQAFVYLAYLSRATRVDEVLQAETSKHGLQLTDITSTVKTFIDADTSLSAGQLFQVSINTQPFI